MSEVWKKQGAGAMRAVLETDLEDRACAGEIKIDDRETAEPLFFTLFRSRMIFRVSAA
jgi:hypothetical protein